MPGGPPERNVENNSRGIAGATLEEIPRQNLMDILEEIPVECPRETLKKSHENFSDKSYIARSLWKPSGEIGRNLGRFSVMNSGKKY